MKPNLKGQIQEFCQLLKNKGSLSTADAYSRRLYHLEVRCEGKRLTPAIVTQTLEGMKELGFKYNSIKAVHDAIKTFAVWQYNNGHRKEFLRVPKMPPLQRDAVQRDCISTEEYLRLIQKAKDLNSPSYLEWRYMIWLGWATGLRLTDIALLGWGNFCWEDEGENAGIPRIVIIPKKTRRFNKPLDIPLDAEDALFKEFMEYRQTYYSDVPIGLRKPWIFPWAMANAQIDGHKTLSMQFRRLADKAGVKKSFHCLRHACVTRMVENGASPVVIASITGHSLKQILTYSHPSDAVKLAALKG